MSIEKVELVHFWYSKKQAARIMNISSIERAYLNQVFVGDRLVTYTEMNTPKSHWDDAVYLGMFPKWHIYCNGVPQGAAMRAHKLICELQEKYGL